MKKLFLLIILAVFIFPFLVGASGLTQIQIKSVLDLLRVFGVSNSQIISVEQALSGQTSTTKPITTSPNVFPVNNTNPQTYSNFLIVSQNRLSSDDNLTVGATEEIDKVDFYLNEQKLKKNCQHENMCQLEIKNFESGIYTLKTSKSNIKPEQITILNTNTKPEITAKTIKLGQENIVKGKNLSDTITVYTILGSYVLKTENNSFKLNTEIPSETLPDYFEKGPLYVENNDGTMSDIIIVNYEI